MPSPIVSTLLEDEPDLVDLVSNFIEKLPDSISEIKQSAGQQDWSELKKQLHDLKGLGGNFGFPELGNIAKQLENDVKNNTYTNIQELLSQLDIVFDRIMLGHKNP